MFEQTKEYLTPFTTARMSAEVKAQLPAKCRNCPVVRYLDERDREDNWSKIAKERKAKRAERNLDVLPFEAVGATAARVKNARQLIQEADEAAAKSAASHSALEQTIELAGGDCIGARLGNLTVVSSVQRALDFAYSLGRDRSCLNPAFNTLKNEENIARALRQGNWVGGILE